MPVAPERHLLTVHMPACKKGMQTAKLQNLPFMFNETSLNFGL